MNEAMCDAAGKPAASLTAEDLKLAARLMRWARAEGVSLDGLLEQLAKSVEEASPEPELAEHRGGGRSSG